MMQKSLKVLGIAAIIFMATGVSAQSANKSKDADHQVAHAPMWPRIDENNIQYKNRVWRDIDALAPELSTCPYSERLGAILIEGALSGSIKAYSTENDRFTTELTHDELVALAGKQKESQPVFKYKIKEDWLFLKEEKVMVVRIVGIAPVMPVTQPDGTTKEQPLLWVYYPESRKLLAQHKVFKSTEKTWDDLLESRDFKSKITQVKVNRGDKQLVTD